MHVCRHRGAEVVALFCVLAFWPGAGPIYAAEGASPARAWLGVTVQPVTADIAASMGLTDVRGALVSEVKRESPAARVGLQAGDVILDVSGHSVTDATDLRNEVSRSEPGSTITLEVLHDGRSETLSPRLDRRPVKTPAMLNAQESGANGPWGLAVEPLTSAMAEALAVPPSTPGVVVTAVDPSSEAATSGLETIDVIEKVNGRPIGSAAELRSALEHTTGKPALLLIDRNGSTLFLAMRTDGR
jgi:serine protease Do